MNQAIVERNVSWSRRAAKAYSVVLVLAASAGLLWPQAQPSAPRHAIDVWLDECLAKDPSTAGTLTCLGQAYAKWDAELNATYQKLFAKLPADGQSALRESQRAWLKYRDQEFLFLDGLYGLMDGSMYQTMRAADRVDVVRKRALELSSYIDVLEE